MINVALIRILRNKQYPLAKPLIPSYLKKDRFSNVRIQIPQKYDSLSVFLSCLGFRSAFPMSVFPLSPKVVWLVASPSARGGVPVVEARGVNSWKWIPTVAPREVACRVHEMKHSMLGCLCEATNRKELWGKRGIA